MFVNRDSLIHSDENAVHRTNNNKTPHRTPKQRRAFGDISNRKTVLGDVNKITALKSKTAKKVSFALVQTPAAPTLKQTPVEDVEVSAGRVWRDQDHDDDDGSILSVEKEQEAWNEEVRLYLEEERTRPLRLREEQRVRAEKQLEERMERVRKQDDEDLAAQMDDILASVETIDLNLDLDDDAFGPRSFPDDISF